MIKTEEYKNIPATILHRLTAETNTEDVEHGIDEAISIVESMGKRYEKINLIINTKGLLFTDLSAHRKWSHWLKTSPAMKKTIDFMIFVTDDSPNARAEMKKMDTEKRKYFFDFNEGVDWLKANIGV